MPSKKHLGQHFLQNKGKLLKIVHAINPNISQVIEIGPGRGELTQHLLAAGFRVVCIEKDVEMTLVLREKFSSEIKRGMLHIIEGDALEKISNFKLSIINTKENYVVVGNIPYYITGHLLRIIGDLTHKPTQTIILIQKEVAVRVCAEPDEMNLLAASVGWWADARIITHVPRSMFSPPPQVDSAVLELTTKTTSGVVSEKNKYFKCVHAVFKQPRRTIVKNLVDTGVKRTLAENALIEIELTLSTRPQELSVEKIIQLSELFI